MNGASDLHFTLAQNWRTYHVLAQPIAYTNEYQQIRFHSSTFVPENTSDQRMLGVAVRHIRVQQLHAPTGSAFPITPRAWFLTATTLLMAAGLRRIGLGMPLVFGAISVLVILLGGLHLYAAPLIAYWLPTTWLLLGGVALALLMAPLREWHSRQDARVSSGPRMLIGGMVVSGTGTLALWMHLPVWVGLPLAVAGTGMALVAVDRTFSTQEIQRLRWERWLMLLGITLVALALRLYRINSLPIALWRDEVYHGQIALEIWRNPAYRPIYVPRVDLPALLFYLIAPIIGIFGPELWTLRIIPALAGALTPLALWFALRPLLGARAAVIASWCMAVAAWGLYMSRWAFPVIFDPLFVLVAIGCIWRGLTPGITQRRAASWLVVGGICTGLAMYTYHTGRLAPLTVGLFAIAQLWRFRLWWRRRLALILGLLAFAITATPLVMYAITNPANFNKRITSVNLLNHPDGATVPPLTTIESNLVRYILMWHVAGDQNARHYAPGRPMIDPVSGALMLLGIGICLSARVPGPRMLILLWLGIGIVPGIFSDAAPHAMRSIGAYAPTCALVGAGLDALLRVRKRSSLPWTIGLGGTLLVAAALWNSLVYYSTTNDQREMFAQFDTTQTLIGRSARIAATKVIGAQPYQVYLWDASMRGVVVRFLTDDLAIGQFDGMKLMPPADKSALLVLPGDASAALQAAAVRVLGAEARLLWVGPRRPDSDAPIYIIYGSGPELQTFVEQLPLP